MLTFALSATAMAQQSSAPPQQQDQHPIFRLGTDIVRVDVYPRRRGRVVEGLQAADFELYEDGVRQTIEAFAFIPAPAGETPPDPRPPEDERRTAADPLNRVFGFYLDAFTVTMESRVGEGAAGARPARTSRCTSSRRRRRICGTADWRARWPRRPTACRSSATT